MEIKYLLKISFKNGSAKYSLDSSTFYIAPSKSPLNIARIPMAPAHKEREEADHWKPMRGMDQGDELTK